MGSSFQALSLERTLSFQIIMSKNVYTLVYTSKKNS